MALSKDAQSALLTFSTAASNATPLAITTLLADDIIVVMAGAEKGAETNLAVSSVTDDKGLTWAKRTAINGATSNSFAALEYWWAHDPLAQAHNITVTFNQAIDDACLGAVAVNGCNLTSPWSATAGATLVGGQNTGTTPPTIPAHNPTEQHLFELAAWFSSINAASGNAGTGFTTLIHGTNAGGTNFGTFDSQFEIVATGRSGSVAFGAGDTASPNWPTTGNAWAMIADALTSDSGGGGGGSAKQIRSGFKWWW